MSRPHFNIATGFVARKHPVNLSSWQAKALYQPDTLDTPFVSFPWWLIASAICAIATAAILILLP